MTAFSLFHRPTFAAKVSSISSSSQQRALLASIHVQAMEMSDVLSHDHFRKLAEESIEEALSECLDESPPLCILQALILTTFQQLTNGVRGRSWRALHTCVSVAYDLHLHLVDKNVTTRNSNETEFILQEEKRRAWWTLWEFDVFASTIRKLPTAIDWANNETWLPVDDDLWFSNTSAISCTLNPDPAVAWKELKKSGNQGSKSWFIVINALMRCGHTIAFPSVYSCDTLHGEVSSVPETSRTVQSNLDVLSNSLYCLSSALPNYLSYNGEFLNFLPGRYLHNDSAKHSIHVMMNLCRFMLYHLIVFNSTYRNLGVASTPSSENLASAASLDRFSSLDNAAWNVYLTAASEIVTIIRNSSPKHVRYVNPFFSSTIWLAAAAQIISRKVGPDYVNPRVAESNLDVLQTNLAAYVSFWRVPGTLQQKLNVLNARMETVGGQVLNSEAFRSQTPPNETNIRLSGMNDAQYFNRRFPNIATSAMQYPAPASQTFSVPSTNHSQAPNGSVWATQQSLNFDGTIPDMTPSNIWGYGLDDLLIYGGFE
ncbi:hypothetical protein D0Z07_8157 [Hyphodiscus hymeniophilus]|uniref:Xylanolytic transcriptional activator regulatory domain-containing protein n=1 Tax=Hyphodiscus hymeniophilus TaxID=353542 RepID=A0A9P7ATZ8_9HELO|nr:hypothetical protein D0Z07_8157 [Hyphodiscus hymeniophilus]